MESTYPRAAKIARTLPRAPRVDFLGVPVDGLNLAETLAAAEAAMAARRPLRQVSLNVAKFVAMRRNPELDADVRSSDLVSVDGMGIVWAARLLGIKLPG